MPVTLADVQPAEYASAPRPTMASHLMVPGEVGHNRQGLVQSQVQFLQPAQDVRSLVLIAPILGPAVMLFVDPDAVEAIEHSVDCDPSLEPGQR